MAIYQLPKSLHPDFAVPGKKPLGDVEIDYSNPLSDNLFFAHAPQHRNTVQDLVSGRQADTKSALSRMVGDYYQQDELSILDPTIWNIAWPYAALGDSDDSDYTMAWSIRIPDKADGTAAVIFRWGAAEIEIKRFLTQIEVKWGSGVRLTISGVQDGDVYDITMTRDKATNNVYHYVNGVLSATVGGIGYTTFNACDTIRYHEEADQRGEGIAFFYCWVDRYFSEAEVKAFNRDPYQILKPKTPAFYFTAESGGGGVTGTSSHQASTSTHTATGERSVTGASSHSAATATHSASGTISGQITGDANHQAETATQSATGERQITGVSAHQANQATHSSAGTVGSVISGSSSHSASPSTHSATGERILSGSATHTASTATHAASGSVGNVVAGSGNHAANDATHSATGLRIVGGTATHQADTSTHSATGSAQVEITGTSSHQATRATHAAVGLRLISGTANHQAQRATQTASDIPIAEIPLGTRQISDLTPIRGILDTSPKYGILKLG